jgi:hypothetical protein
LEPVLLLQETSEALQDWTPLFLILGNTGTRGLLQLERNTVVECFTGEIMRRPQARSFG